MSEREIPHETQVAEARRVARYCEIALSACGVPGTADRVRVHEEPDGVGVEILGNIEVQVPTLESEEFLLVRWHYHAATRWEPEDMSDEPLGAEKSPFHVARRAVEVALHDRIAEALANEGEAEYYASAISEWDAD